MTTFIGRGPESLEPNGTAYPDIKIGDISDTESAINIMNNWQATGAEDNIIRAYQSYEALAGIAIGSGAIEVIYHLPVQEVSDDFPAAG